MIRIPNPQSITPFSIPNNSDKGGNIWYTKNLNFDEEGYIKLSPRTVQLYDEALATAASGSFDVPITLSRYDSGKYIIPTAGGDVFNSSFGVSSLAFTENEGTNNPSPNTRSHGVVWQGRIYVSDSTVIAWRALGGATGNWDNNDFTLTDSPTCRHYMVVHRGRNTLCVTDMDDSGSPDLSVVRQFTKAHAASTTLSLPFDFEAVGLAYNNENIGIITRLGTSTEGQNTEAYFFLWDGADTSANGSWGVGSDSCIAICAYKSSFLILTRSGELKYFNGGGFDTVAAFPFYFTDNVYGDLLNQKGRGDLMVADGDIVYINLSLELNDFGRKSEQQLVNCPSGVWTFDPKVGLYHRASPSISQAYVFLVEDASVDTSTNIFTVISGTIPQSGSIVRYTSASTVVGGLELNQDYYVIKLTSSTFKLATTKDNAIAGTAIDITSKGTGGNNYFWMYDITDYGQTYTNEAGAVVIAGETNMISKDFIIGSDVYSTALSINANFCMGVPELEARGYLVTPKIFSSQVTDSEQKLYVKYRPLKSSDSIVVKSRTRHAAGLPVSSPQNFISAEAVWGSARVFNTTANLSDALTAFNAGIELELELVAGAGAGTCIKIDNLYQVGSTYNVVLGSDVIGAAATLKSYFIIDHWVERTTITSSTTTNSEGFAEVPISGTGSWVQFKIELRGVNVSIEELQVINEPAKKSA